MSSSPGSVRELDLSPIPGKEYWSTPREWREEFIYFLLVDRFHDGRARRHLPPNREGKFAPERLKRFCGGTLRGITDHLDYVKGLGCTSVWLSPVFENEGAPDPSWSSYHGYAVRNFLKVDSRFGTKEDLVELVGEAHRRGMRVILDAVANHGADLFSYANGDPRYFDDGGTRYELGSWRDAEHPIPAELRNPDYFHRRGQIRGWGWDNVPETQWGDFFSLKGFYNEEDETGLAMQQVLIDAYRYWIREADIDGFRMDAVKHMGELAVARFSQAMREYAYSLGKRDFFLFGELVGGDAAINRYAGPNTPCQKSDRTIFYGLESVLDFPLWWVLPGVIKGFDAPGALFARYEALRERALSRGELGRFLVTFVDNHDQIGQNWKRRFSAGAFDGQVIAAIGYLICALGTPCIYYGTEQGLGGQGNSDEAIREPMFDLDDPGVDGLDQSGAIYRAIAAIAAVHRSCPALRFGRMYFRETSWDGSWFRLPCSQPCILAFSRLLARQEALVAYNTSTTERRAECVIVDGALSSPGDRFRFRYGREGDVAVEEGTGEASGARFVRLDLAPMEFVVLERVG
jgi:alpha-amylase